MVDCLVKIKNVWVYYWLLRKSIISVNIIGDLSGFDGFGRGNKVVKWKNIVV